MVLNINYSNDRKLRENFMLLVKNIDLSIKYNLFIIFKKYSQNNTNHYLKYITLIA